MSVIPEEKKPAYHVILIRDKMNNTPESLDIYRDYETAYGIALRKAMELIAGSLGHHIPKYRDSEKIRHYLENRGVSTDNKEILYKRGYTKAYNPLTEDSPDFRISIIEVMI